MTKNVQFYSAPCGTIQLLFYSPVFPPSIGGIETIVYSLATGLAELCDASGTPQFKITCVTQTQAGSFNDAALPFSIARSPTFWQLFDLIRSCDVVHIACPSMVPMVLGLILGKPVIVEHHGFQNICPTGQLLQEPTSKPCPGHFMLGNYGQCLRCRTNGNWRNSLKQLLSTWVRRWIAPRIFANIMPTEYLGSLLQLPNSVTIHHGLPILDQARARHPSVVTNQPIRLVYQGRLVSTKGIGTLIEAAAILHHRQRSFQLIVIGDGPERHILETSVGQRGINDIVCFAGRISDDELTAMITASDILIVPSLAGEVFGLVIAENMARGLAIVASDIGAFAEVLGPAGRTFHVGDAHDLADQLDELIQNPSLIPALGHQAQQRVFENFERSHMINQHATLYRKAFAAR